MLVLAVPFLELCLLLFSPRRAEPTTTSRTHSQNLPIIVHSSPLRILASPFYTNFIFKTTLNISLCCIWLKNCCINLRGNAQEAHTWYNGIPCSQKTKLTPFGLTRFLRLRFRPVPPKNGNTGHTLLLWASPITSVLLLPLFFLYLVNACGTKSAPFPPALTYHMKASDFHLPAL